MSRTDHHRPWQIQADDPAGRHPRAYVFTWHGMADGWTLPHTVVASGPDREYRRAIWWGPQRQKERQCLRALAMEYTEHGDLDDDDVVNHQHRHQAHWLWF